MESKPTLIIIPGWGGTKQTWQAFIDCANNDFDIHCVELPCFGNEPCPTEVWGVEEYANFIKLKITRLRPVGALARQENLVILAHSFGGQVAVQLVGTNPGICGTLILSGSAIFRKKWSLKRLVFWPIAKVGKLLFSLPGLARFNNLARRILYKTADSPDYSKTDGIKREIFKKVTTQDVSHFLPGITARTLVVTGDCDTYVPARLSKRVASLIPNSQFVLVKGGRHGLHIKDPVGFKTIIQNFLINT